MAGPLGHSWPWFPVGPARSESGSTDPRPEGSPSLTYGRKPTGVEGSDAGLLVTRGPEWEDCQHDRM